MPGSPPDALFKQVFSEPRRAMAEVRAVVPPGLEAYLDFDPAERVPGSFVDEELARSHSDLLFRLAHRGRQAFVYILFEHQSEPDGLLPFRMLRYVVRIWERWLSENKGARTLPLVIPLTLSHAESGWNAPRGLSSLYDVEPPVMKEIGGHVPEFELLLDDLALQDDETLRRRVMDAMGRLALLVLKHGRRDEDLGERLVAWRELVREVVAAPSGVAALSVLLRYALRVNRRVSPERLVNLLREKPGDAIEEAVMTAGERLIEQGRQQGIQQGLQQGLQQGVVLGKKETLLVILQRRFGPALPPYVTEHLSDASVEMLDRWFERALEVDELSDVFAE